MKNSAKLLPKKNRSVEKPVDIKLEKKRKLVSCKKIIRFQADRNYTMIYLLNGKSFMSSRNLKFYEIILSGTGFLRVHQSHLINPEHIKSYKKGKYVDVLCLIDKSEIPVAFRRRTPVKKSLLF
ncbi:MAG: LytTR family transcriptional regulator [Bacteroidales bacterium]|nr:LytTR family transcriptional regulator [Bacteroidales bacterium]